MDILYTSDGCAYQGMDMNTVISLRKDLGKDTIFIDKITYDNLISAK